MATVALDLDLEVFQGPFDLLLTLVLQEEVDLLEVDLADVVIAYVEHLKRSGELDLEATTEFLVLIAALLEIKSRLMLPGESDEGIEIEAGEAAEELLARMLEYRRYRGAAEYLRVCLGKEEGYRYRSAPLPPALRKVSLDGARQCYDPVRLAEALGGLLRIPPPLDLGLGPAESVLRRGHRGTAWPVRPATVQRPRRSASPCPSGVCATEKCAIRSSSPIPGASWSNTPTARS